VSIPSVLILACGALSREIKTLVEVNGFSNIKVEYLPASLHNRPERICDLLRDRLTAALPVFDRVLVGYADCGTGGEIDRLCADLDVGRLPGSHCYEFYLGSGEFDTLHDEEPGTFYLTDYLVKHFDRLVFEGLGIDDHPELFQLYFGNYRRAVYLSQLGAPEGRLAAERAADRLGLPLTTIETGFGQLEDTINDVLIVNRSEHEVGPVSVAISV